MGEADPSQPTAAVPHSGKGVMGGGPKHRRTRPDEMND